MADTVLKRFDTLPPSWSHEYGAMFMGLLDVWRQTGDRRYFDFVKRHIDAVVGPDGSIAGYVREKYSLDDLISGRLLFPLYDETGDERYRKAAATLRDHLRGHPRTSDGGFWHKGELTSQMLLDGVYMGAPFYAEYARRENDPEGMNDAIRQPLLLVEHSRDGASGLFYHGWNEDRKQSWANPETGCSPSFWGRALGWYSMALADLLDIAPKTHPQYAELLAAYKDLMRALLKVQDPESGLWWHVLDQGGRKGNYLEASASLMFLYALARGISRGHLPAEPFRAAVDKGFAGATERLVGEEGDLLTVKNVCKTAGLGVKPGRDGSFDYYISEPVVDNDFKGFAGFLLAASAYESL
jgi:unsaturated rhamnogalacturonyl hydrolase